MKRQFLRIGRRFFLNFHDLVVLNTNKLFLLLQPLSDGSGELLLGDAPDDLFTGNIYDSPGIGGGQREFFRLS
jgi:hypothetical protein